MTEDNVLQRNPDVRLHNRITMTMKTFPASLIYSGAARPGRKQATTEDFEFHIPYL